MSIPNKYIQQLQFIKQDYKASHLKKRVEKIGTINSKLAQFYILDSYTTLKKEGITLEELLNIWLDNIAILAKINKIARRRFTLKYEQATYFAIHCLAYLVSNNIESTSSEVLSCPFTNNAWNFIHTLFKTNSCLCLCYATYIRAAAEEFRYIDYIHLCNSKNKSSIILTKENTTYTLTQKDINSFNLIGLPHFLQSKASITIGQTFSTPDISVSIRLDTDINIETTLTSGKDLINSIDNFIVKYVFDTPTLQDKVTTVVKSSALCNSTFYWNDIVAIVNRILVKRDFNSMITQLLYLGYVYDISLVIDNVLLIYLIYTSRDIEYTRWEEKLITWREYTKLRRELEDIAAISMNVIYTYMENINLEPPSIHIILSIPDLLLGKSKLK